MPRAGHKPPENKKSYERDVKMIYYLIKYAINKSIFKRVVIEAATYTQAYILFSLKFPSDYEITEIIEAKGEILPPHVDFSQKKKVKITIC